MKYSRAKLGICLLGCLVLISCSKKEDTIGKEDKTDSTNITQENSYQKDTLEKVTETEDKSLQQDQEGKDVDNIPSIIAEEPSESATQKDTDVFQKEAQIDHSVPVEVEVDETCIEIPCTEVDLSEHLMDENEDHSIEIIPEEEIIENESEIDISN